MAFNGSGTFVRVYNWATDKTNLVPVTASRMDTEFDGIATGLSTAIAKDGQTPTTARIPFASGTSAVAGSTSSVSYSFSSDPNTGLYSPATDQYGLVAGGVVTLTSTATVVTIPVDLAVTGDITVDDLTVGDDLVVTGDLTVSGALSFLPAGIIVPYAGSAAPTGWLICDGASLVRATYPALFTAISTTYGAADGSHFTLPDLTGRVIAGKEASETRLTTAVSGINGGTLGASGGAQSQTLTIANLPTVTPAGSIVTTITDPDPSFGGANGSGSTFPSIGSGNNNLSSNLTWTATSTFTGTPFGSGTAHAIVQPTIVLNYIIKT